ncbi:MAG: hypothetical protein ACI4PK_04375, partial [Oscillospiraceae bacterium]
MFKIALKRVVSNSLAATMLLTQLNLGIKAANSAPTKFIPVADLNTSTTKYSLCKGKTEQKVYFGKKPNFDKVTGTC